MQKYIPSTKIQIYGAINFILLFVYRLVAMTTTDQTFLYCFTCLLTNEALYYLFESDSGLNYERTYCIWRMENTTQIGKDVNKFSEAENVIEEKLQKL